MNWSERHLNWTAVFTILGYAILYFLLMNVSTGWYSIFPILTRYRILILDIAMPVLSYGYLFLNALTFLWILTRKRRSVFFLFFYLPALIFTYMGIFPWWRAENPNTQILIQWFGYAIMLAGWIVIIALPLRKQKVNQTSELPTNTAPISNNRPGRFSTIILLNIVSVLISIMLLVSLSSFIYMRAGTTTFEYSQGKGYHSNEIPAFSFEHPVSFSVNIEYWNLFQDQPDGFVSGIREYGFFGSSSSGISVWIFTFDSINGTRRSLDDELLSHDLWFSAIKNSLNTIQYPSNKTTQNVPFLDTTIDGRPARYITFSGNGGSDSDSNYSTDSLYFFECSDFLWVIRLTDYDRIANHPPTYFTHLLETFKIYDE
jgi:hypothetical protein